MLSVSNIHIRYIKSIIGFLKNRFATALRHNGLIAPVPRWSDLLSETAPIADTFLQQWPAFSEPVSDILTFPRQSLYRSVSPIRLSLNL